ncbi:hypothetical protein ACROYT_G009514 [Oculina patagonica]
MGLKCRVFVFISLPLLCYPGCLLVRCHLSDTSSPPQAVPTSSTGFLQMTAVPTPLLRPLPQPNPVASLPVSSRTVQPTRSLQRLLSISCSADVKMINPAHAQLLSATTVPILRPTALTTSFESAACRPVAKNISVIFSDRSAPSSY